MRGLIQLLKRLRADEEGTALMEYTILLGIIAVACITVAFALQGWINGTWTAFCTALETAGATGLGACP